MVGVYVLNGSAPTLCAPVPPHSTLRPTDITNSCSGFLKTRYLKVVSRFWNPFAPIPIGPPGALRWLWVAPNETANASVIRLENSAEISRCLKEGSSPVLKLATVGSDSSSLTPGSSMPSVAGKKRLPTISWATLPPRGMSASASPGRPARKRRMDMKFSAKLTRERIGTADGRQVHVNGGGALGWVGAAGWVRHTTAGASHPNLR